jgi:hypothetical protein
MQLVNENLLKDLNEKKKEPLERESYSIKKSRDDKFDISNSKKDVVKTFSSKELTSFLSKSGFSSINAKSTTDDLKSGDKKIKIFLASPKIFESQNFERGEDPLDKMNIGQKEIDRKFIEETKWAANWQEPNIPFKLLKNRKPPVIILYDPTEELGSEYSYIALSTRLVGDWKNSPEIALGSLEDKEKKLKSLEDGDGNGIILIPESLKFERTGEPLEKMNVGQEYINKEIIRKTWWYGFDDVWNQKYENEYKILEFIPDYGGFL